MKKLVKEAGLEDEFVIASAATSTEELGNPVYPPARRILAANGISCEGKRARQITKKDYAAYDLLIGMDYANLRNMKRCFGGDPAHKLSLLLTNREVADPWYSDNFTLAWQDIYDGCTALLKRLQNMKK